MANVIDYVDNCKLNGDIFQLVQEMDSNKCLRPKLIRKISNYRIIPCGNCPSCLRRKGNEMFVRCFEQLKDYGFLRVFTLTYSPENLPVMENHFKIIRDGEHKPYLKSLGIPRFVSSSDFLNLGYFNWVTVKRKSGKVIHCKKYSPYSVVLGDDMFIQFQSINRKHVSKWLRDNRLRYKRSHDGKDSDLKYVIVQEYGSNTWNPHYHGLFFCSDSKFLDDLRDSWNYGFVYEDSASESDHEHVSKIAKYCTKYISKGKFDCPYIKRGYCQKPRVMISCNFGISSDWQKIKDFILCKDVYGDIDQESFKGSELDDYSELVDGLRSRRSIDINGFSYGLPRYYKHKIFFREEFDKERHEFMVRASPLSQMVAESILRDLDRDGYNTEVRLQRIAESSGKSFFEVESAYLAAQRAQASAYDKDYLNLMKSQLKSF